MIQTEQLPKITEINICHHCHGEDYLVPTQVTDGAGSGIAVCADCGKEVGVVDITPGPTAKRGWLAKLFGG